ncbi:MAG: hypothetical protein WCO48_01250 [Candidatus Taylorbacteria bacterium]
MDTTLKKKLMAKAKKEGLTISSFLNFAAREYINGNIKMTVFQRDLAEAREDIRRGRYMTAEEVFEKLGL